MSIPAVMAANGRDFARKIADQNLKENDGERIDRRQEIHVGVRIHVASDEKRKGNKLLPEHDPES